MKSLAYVVDKTLPSSITLRERDILEAVQKWTVDLLDSRAGFKIEQPMLWAILDKNGKLRTGSIRAAKSSAENAHACQSRMSWKRAEELGYQAKQVVVLLKEEYERLVYKAGEA